MKVTIYHRRRFHSETSRIAELKGRLAIVDNAVSTLTGRSGNIIFDERTAAPLQRRFTYEMDATGRLVTVLEDGAVAARYNYDSYEQRISKAIEGETAIHYHYDEEGRLIAETDGTTGVPKYACARAGDSKSNWYINKGLDTSPRHQWVERF